MILFISPKTAYITKRLLDEAALANIEVETFSIQELADKNFAIDINRYDVLYIRFCYPYFEQTVELAKKFIAAGKKVVDASLAQGDVGLGKMADYEKLSAAGIPVPKTERFLEAKQWQYPCIAKWTYGFGGKEVFLVKNVDDLHRATELVPPDELLLQEFIPAEFEYKIVTVGNKSLPVILRFEIDQKIWRPDFGKHQTIQTPTTPQLSGALGEVRSLSSLSEEEYRPQGGEVVGDDKMKKIVQLAEQSSRLLNRELAKVDILESQGKFYILEVNRWPGLKSFEELTKYNAAKDFLAYLIAK